MQTAFRLPILLILLLLIENSFGQTDINIKKQGQLVHLNYQDTLIADVMPEFPGGLDSLYYQFMLKNLVYPQTNANVQGTILVEFIIDSLGKVIEPKIIRSIHPLFDEEVLRVVNIMPDWKPALHEGKPVSTYFVFPVKFTIN